MASDPNYSGVNPRVLVGTISTANTNLDGTGTGPATPIGAAAPAGGMHVHSIVVKALTTTTAGMVRLYVYDGSGTDARLFSELPVTAITKGASTPAWESDRLEYDDFVIPSGSSLTASTEKAETFNVFAFVSDFEA